VKAKFIPLGDLSNLSEEQKLDYYNNVCEHFEVPAELNLLYFDWFDSGDGARKYILYAAKGFSDFMRGKLGIETDSLEESVSDGVVRYKCKGHDKDGRHEIAIGASTIAGLTGKKLEDSFAKAQTKATRRMTLQFVGAGILDESEKSVTSLSVDISSAGLPLAQLPTVEINAAKGKLVEMANEATNRAVDMLHDQHPLAFEAVKVSGELVAAVNGLETELRRRPGPKQSDNLVVDTNLGTVDTNLGTVDTNLGTPAELTFKQWLSRLTNEILPPPPSGQSGTFTTYGGMKPSLGVGGVSMKVVSYARKVFPGKEIKEFTLDDQNAFKKGFDNVLKEQGAVGLVKHINDSLGVKEG
jgi:hypothetical protein